LAIFRQVQNKKSLKINGLFKFLAEAVTSIIGTQPIDFK